MHVRTSATASLAGLATRMMTAMLAMDIAKMLGMSQMLASFVVDMTAVLTGSATPTLEVHALRDIPSRFAAC